VKRYVSDAIVDLLTELGCTYLPLNPGSSFRGLHDSLVNHRDDGPQVILCTHEEIAVAAAHAYAKATGKVAFAAVHDLVGLMHASMAVYDAWCDRTPIVLLGGGGPADPAERGPIDWFHSANTQSALVRPFVKWDDDPVTPQAMLDGIAQAYRVAASAPQAPTYVTLDSALQERADDGLIGRTAEALAIDPPLAVRDVELEQATDLLVGASLPVVVAGRVGLDASCTPLLVELAEALGAPCRDERNHTALPTGHPLNLNGDTELLDEADVLLAVDLHDLAYVLNSRRDTSSRPEIIDLSLNTLALRSWANAGSGLRPADVRLIADPRHGLEQLLEAVRRRLAAEPAVDKERRRARAARIAARHDALRSEQAEDLARRWDQRPISVQRLVAEVFGAVKHLPWLLTLRNTRSWPEGVWEFDRGGRYLGHSGGGGVGYGPGAMLGGALAARDRGEFPVGIIGDGDLLFAPGALWSAAHYGVPMLIVVNNNRSYYNDEQHQGVVADDRGRPRENAHVGTTLHSPDVDFGSIARGQGVWAGEPVSDPEHLAAALSAAVEQVVHGRVALVDVHTATR
jgi:thiamine pyrophosphate-dependent acetolactate synthase large subunit-like protein